MIKQWKEKSTKRFQKNTFLDLEKITGIIKVIGSVMLLFTNGFINDLANQISVKFVELAKFQRTKKFGFTGLQRTKSIIEMFQNGGLCAYHVIESLMDGKKKYNLNLEKVNVGKSELETKKVNLLKNKIILWNIVLTS